MAKICIDPGHGGSDTGATNKTTGLKESTVDLAVGLRVKSLAEADGHTIVMTRETDRDVAYPGAPASRELQARCDIANNARADIFVSIHCNSFSDPAAHGVETLYAKDSEHGEDLAGYIQEELVKLGFTDRGIKNDPLYVTKYTDMPAALAELPFISNPDEADLLCNDLWQLRFADAIYEGIRRYFMEVGA
jgi:N-acetylmuramoyl-L-alanine amidase